MIPANSSRSYRPSHERSPGWPEKLDAVHDFARCPEIDSVFLQCLSESRGARCIGRLSILQRSRTTIGQTHDALLRGGDLSAQQTHVPEEGDGASQRTEIVLKSIRFDRDLRTGRRTLRAPFLRSNSTDGRTGAGRPSSNALADGSFMEEGLAAPPGLRREVIQRLFPRLGSVSIRTIPGSRFLPGWRDGRPPNGSG